MPQTPAYPDFQVVSTGLAMLASGEVPDPKSLHAALGRRGNPMTAWRVWEAHVNRQQPLDRAIRFPDDDEAPISPALRTARENYQAATIGLNEAVRREAVEPLERRLAATQKLLERALRDIAILEGLLADAYPEPVASPAPANLPTRDRESEDEAA